MLGECWPRELAGHDTAHVFISPCLADPVDVLGTLVNELIHAALPPTVGHRRPFRKAALAIGLTGKMTATTVGPALELRLNALSKALGAYPHVPLDGRLGPKQGTRLRLYACACVKKIRAATDSLNATCNDCGELFKKRLP